MTNQMTTKSKKLLINFIFSLLSCFTDQNCPLENKILKKGSNFKKMEKMNDILQYTGSSYDGDIKNERMEGKGTYSFSSGTRYEGELLDGRFHGKGTLHMTRKKRWKF